MESKRISLTRLSKAGLVTLLMGCVLFAGLAASSPSIHRVFHRDADSADHHCLITLFSHSEISEAGSGVVLVLAVLIFSGIFRVPSGFVVVSSDYRLLPGRAPPSPLFL